MQHGGSHHLGFSLKFMGLSSEPLKHEVETCMQIETAILTNVSFYFIFIFILIFSILFIPKMIKFASFQGPSCSRMP